MSTMATFAEPVNGQQVQVIGSCGEVGKTIALPTNNSTINLNDAGWELSLILAPYDPKNGIGTPSTPYTNLSPSADGTEALWTLQGTEFPPPTGGLFAIDYRGRNTVSGMYLKDRILVFVKDAWA